MIFSKACEYGIRATIYIAQQSLNNNRVSLKLIAAEIDSPEAFTAKILQMLAKNGILNSSKGAKGGFEIKVNDLKKIKLMDIALAIEDNLKDKACVLGLKECSKSNPCPVHHKYKNIRKDIFEMLKNTTLDEMSNSVNINLSYLKNLESI